MNDQLSSLQLKAFAVESTGLTDFGPIPFDDGLNALVNAVNNKKNWHENALQYLQAKISQILINRLQVQDLVLQHPEILEEKISAPFIIVGLPRTGTTILQTLMALDPACRFLRNWESSMAICPPPRLLHSDTDPRISTLHQTMQGLQQAVPALKAINGLNFMPAGTAECQNLMAHAFRSFEYCAGFDLPEYGEWLLTCDMQPGYQYHKLLLQQLQWQCPNEYWVLKAPMHLMAIDTLMQTYPDARIIFTHRDPFTAMISGSSLVYNWSILASTEPDKAEIGKWFPPLWQKALMRALQDRNKWPGKQFYDLDFKRMASDFIKEIHSIYAYFGQPLSPGHDLRMAAWLRDNPKSSLGSHTYSAGEFALVREEEENRFSDYRQRFAV